MKLLPPKVNYSYRQLATKFRAWWRRNDLSYLAALYGTDKFGAHSYTEEYQRYFAPLKQKRLNLLEIGIGGYGECGKGGESLRMWKAYFPNSQIVGLDIHDKNVLREKRINTFQCDQTDAEALTALSEKYGGFDIIVDDGSHQNDHVIRTFLILFPLLRPGGIYAVEDVQTSYWPGWGGGIDNPKSSMAFFKKLVDGLNYAEFPIENYQPSYFDKAIVEIAFFHNLVLIRKGNNDEKTNMPVLVKREIRAIRRAGLKNC